MKSLVKKSARLFLQGLLALLPILVTLLVVSWLFGFAMRVAGNFLVFLPSELRAIRVVELAVQVLVMIGLVGAVILFGLLTRTLLGRSVVNAMERTLDSVPFVRTLYKTSKQVVDLFSFGKSMEAFRPVLVEYPSPGIWVLAFYTGAVGEELTPDGLGQHHTVFVPTTPNPTSGFLCIVPTSRVRPLTIPVEQAMKIIFTAGAIKR